jgi:hypothetical protein
MEIKWFFIMLMGVAFAIAAGFAATSYSATTAFNACLQKSTPAECSAAVSQMDTFHSAK